MLFIIYAIAKPVMLSNIAATLVIICSHQLHTTRTIYSIGVHTNSVFVILMFFVIAPRNIVLGFHVGDLPEGKPISLDFEALIFCGTLGGRTRQRCRKELAAGIIPEPFAKRF